MSGRLTTHVLDTAHGCPAASIAVALFRLENAHVLLCNAETNADGRCERPLLEGDAFTTGRYQLVFRVGAYFARRMNLPSPPFLDEIVLRFALSAADTHYHIPLLVSPYGYSTYRGS